MIHGGYYIKARKIQESDIAFAPPHVREIWDWLLKEANHKDVRDVPRGSTVRSLKDIQEGLRWYVGYRKEMYSKSKCEMAMNWLRKRGMITTMKTTRGMFITVCNYDTYQDSKNYETNNENAAKPTRKKQGSDTINKNDKNDKNEKKREERYITGEIKKIDEDPTDDFLKDKFSSFADHMLRQTVIERIIMNCGLSITYEVALLTVREFLDTCYGDIADKRTKLQVEQYYINWVRKDGKVQQSVTNQAKKSKLQTANYD